MTKKRKIHFQAKCDFFYTENKQTGQLIFSFFVTLTKKWNKSITNVCDRNRSQTWGSSCYYKVILSVVASWILKKHYLSHNSRICFPSNLTSMFWMAWLWNPESLYRSLKNASFFSLSTVCSAHKAVIHFKSTGSNLIGLIIQSNSRSILRNILWIV